jgi:hypothetical protein
MTNILVVGYYNHCNLGDEQYKLSIKHIVNHFPNYKPKSVEFLDCDKLPNYNIVENTVVLLGGGDVLNTYFLDKINKKFTIMENRPKIIAFSVGIPYNSIFLNPENLKKLEIFDHIYLRTRQDIPLFSQFINANKVSYLPDASCYLPDACIPSVPTPSSYFTAALKKQIPSKNDIYKKLYSALYSLHKTKKIINVNLCRHIYHPEYSASYDTIVRELARFFEELTKRGYYLVLLPFNTKPTQEGKTDDSNSENDILIHNDVLLHIKNKSNILNIDYELSLTEILSLYPFFYMSLPMRFHGTLFSINAAVPMIPIYTTKKIRNILLDIGWKYEYVFEKNEKDLPLSFNCKKMMMTFLDCVRHHTKGKILLKGQFDNFKQYYKQEMRFLESKLFSPLDSIDIIPTPKTIDKQENLQLYDSYFSPLTSPDNILYNENIKFSENPLNSKKTEENNEDLITNIYNKLQKFANEHKIDDFRNITDSVLKNIAVCVVSYFLTGQLDSQYNHGLADKMFSIDYQYNKEWNWVLQHYKINGKPKEILPDNSNGIFNIGYIDQNDQSGAHRSGWKYVYDNLIPFNNSKAPLLLDLYIDRTFHWKRDIYKQIGIIPYRSPWMGFIHHTFNETFSKYNNNTLMDCPEFIESLTTCKGIIVLSHYLKRQFEDEFNSRNINVHVYLLNHPTELTVPLFNMQGFIDNSDKKLIHIGGWLRNIFSFYQLELKPRIIMRKNEMLKTETLNNRCLPKMKSVLKKFKQEEYRIRKVCLKGKYMDNYYPCDKFTEKLSKALIALEPTIENESKFCSQTTLQNNWMKNMIEYVDNIVIKTDVISTVDNNSYDNLLTNNLVFLNLVDGSAVNTLIECIIRNTPVFVNKHPAAVEVLGADYPLYYDDPSKINQLLEEPLCIRDAYEHMKKINKSSYQINKFVKELLKIVEI